jgi:hypothetical protein
MTTQDSTCARINDEFWYSVGALNMFEGDKLVRHDFVLAVYRKTELCSKLYKPRKAYTTLHEAVDAAHQIVTKKRGR